MDNRRLTISSEEQIGEALMRVSNTLEAQRLTKSLEYQEKIRRRTAFRMVLSIILVLTLLLMLIVGGLLLYVLWKYMDPILQRLLPFLDKVFKDFGTIWNSLVESSTYMPTFLDTASKMMDELLKTMQNMHGLPLKEMLYNVNNILATTNGMLAGVNNMMAGAGNALASMGQDINGLMTTMMADTRNFMGSVSGLMADTGSFMNGASGLMADTGTFMTNTGEFMQGVRTDMQPVLKETAGLLNGLNEGFSVLGDKIGALEDFKKSEEFKGIVNTAGQLGDITKTSVQAIWNVVDDKKAEGITADINNSMNALNKLVSIVNATDIKPEEAGKKIDALLLTMGKFLQPMEDMAGVMEDILTFLKSWKN